MTQHSNPYQFRKLVFWASSSSVNLNLIGSQIDSVVMSTTVLANSYKTVVQKVKPTGTSSTAGTTVGAVGTALPATPTAGASASTPAAQ